MKWKGALLASLTTLLLTGCREPEPACHPPEFEEFYQRYIIEERNEDELLPPLDLNEDCGCEDSCDW